MIISEKDPRGCQSCYAMELEAYIAKRSLELADSTLAGERRYVLAFDRYISSKTDSRVALTNGFIEEWIAHRPWEKMLTQQKRLNFTKKLFLFLKNRGVYVEEITLHLKNVRSDYIPHIFTKEEIQRIFTAADCYNSTTMSPYLHLTVPVSFRILYGCGLRSSELVHLKISDVDLDASMFYIHNTKFNKARYVPFSESLGGYIREYICKRYNGSMDDGYFIAKKENRPYGTGEVHYWFLKLLYHAGIPHNGKGYGPRVHDLRHTFAVHSLQKSITEGKAPESVLPLLSAYLGHKDLRGTQIYLHLTSALYPHIISVIEDSYGNLLNGGGSHEQ